MAFQQLAKRVLRWRLYKFLIALPLVCYLVFFVKYSSPYPIYDDYDVILHWLHIYLSQDRFLEKLNFIFAQHNEHRLALNRLFVLAYYFLIGDVKLIHLIYIGNIAWFLVVILFLRNANENGLTKFYLVSVSLFLANLAHWELITWAMGSIQQYFQLLLSIFSIWLFCKNKVVLSSVFFYFASFTGGGGLLVGPVLLLMSFYQKRWKEVVFLSAVTLIVFYLYFSFLQYGKPQHHPSIVDAIFQPKVFVSYCFAFLGGVFRKPAAAISYGLILMLGFCIYIFLILKHKTFLHHRFNILILLFVLLTAFVTALTRSGFGVGQALASRYSIYSLIFITTLSIGLITELKAALRVRFSVAIFFLSVFLYFYTLPSALKNTSIRYDALASGQLLYPDAQVAEQIQLLSERFGKFKK